MSDHDRLRGMLADLGRRLAMRNLDELRVLDAVLMRLELGAERYGPLDLTKPRDWRRERGEELLDAMIYDVAGELAARDRAIAELHELARLEMFPAQRVDLVVSLGCCARHDYGDEGHDASCPRAPGPPSEWGPQPTTASTASAKLALEHDDEPYAEWDVGGEAGA